MIFQYGLKPVGTKPANINRFRSHTGKNYLIFDSICAINHTEVNEHFHLFRFTANFLCS